MMHSSINKISSEIFSAIVENFPVVSASDEFYYFPQVRLVNPEWEIWDRFSSDFITHFISRLYSWENNLDHLFSHISASSSTDQTELLLLKKLVHTLQEHLEETRSWETQPTFYLMIASLGLAEALNSKNPDAAHLRAGTLPGFLDQAGQNLKSVPRLFCDLGLEMIKDTQNYFISLLPRLPELSSALDALVRFKQTLKSLKTYSKYVLPEELLDSIVTTHINCEMEIPTVNEILDLEIEEMTARLHLEAKNLGYDTWQAAYESIPLTGHGQDGIVKIYSNEVQRLGLHCRDTGLVHDKLYRENPVRVMPVPKFLAAIRSASSYSIPPRHPPSGGIFYIINAHDPAEIYKDYHREYQILSAHETWPGHHLLDISRWSLESTVLRAVEQPIFYEGWACFAEEMLFHSGYLSGSKDSLLLAKRRLWRAIRGKVDLGIQTNTMNLSAATEYLTRTGMTREQARASARKYSLNPGYQLCYTVGLRKFLQLFQRYGKNSLKKFSKVVLNQGEIGFNELEEIIKESIII
ncbi:MAG: DUF885 family protein [Thermodesulfobacteriota bacterium]